MRHIVTLVIDGPQLKVDEAVEHLQAAVSEIQEDHGVTIEIKAVDVEGSSFDAILDDLCAHAPTAIGRTLNRDKLEREYVDLRHRYNCNEVSEVEVYEIICSETERGLTG